MRRSRHETDTRFPYPSASHSGHGTGLHYLDILEVCIVRLVVAPMRLSLSADVSSTRDILQGLYKRGVNLAGRGRPCRNARAAVTNVLSGQRNRSKRASEDPIGCLATHGQPPDDVCGRPETGGPMFALLHAQAQGSAGALLESIKKYPVSRLKPNGHLSGAPPEP